MDIEAGELSDAQVAGQGYLGSLEEPAHFSSSVSLGDPRVGAGGKVFQELLTDLSVGPPAPGLCKSA